MILVNYFGYVNNHIKYYYIFKKGIKDFDDTDTFLSYSVRVKQ